MVCGSPGSAHAISGRGTSLNPGPESMPSAGANHGGKLRRAAGAAQVRGRSGSGARQGQLRCRMAVGAYENLGGGGGGGGVMFLVGN